MSPSRCVLAIAFAGSLLAAPAAAFLDEIHSTGGGGNWSSASTWTRISGTGTTPHAGDIVVITNGNPVTLNTNTGIGDLAHLDVQDEFKVQDGTNYTLGVARIDVGLNGTGADSLFQVGTEASPFSSNFTLTLTDNYLSSTYSGSPPGATENMTFMVHSAARLELHGKTLNVYSEGHYLPIPSWIRLEDGEDLEAGTNSLVLEAHANGWGYRDHIVIASTDFDMLQAEERQISTVSGATVTLTSNVTYDHNGDIELGLVDERAEVGLLSRNILIKGDGTVAVADRGGHVMFVKDDEEDDPPIFHIEGIEMRAMGWKSLKGRYPIHIHQLGETSGNYVQSSSIHGCYNRALAIHGTTDVLVKDVVAYDSWGHMFMLEDTTEVRNVLQHNLGLVSRRPVHPEAGKKLGQEWTTTGEPYFLASDEEVSTFWIRNTDNTVEDNAAAGSDAHGFWYDLIEVPVAELAVVPVRFSGNSSHSNGVNGFHNEATRMITVDETGSTTLDKLDVASVFEDFTSWKNRGAGIWNRAYGQSRWVNARLADNLLAIYLASEGFQEDYQIYCGSGADDPLDDVDYFEFSATGAPGFSFQSVEDSVIVGETDNVGNFPASGVEDNWPGGGRSLPDPGNPQEMLKGLEIYDGAIAMYDTDFYNFEDAEIPSPPAPLSKPGGTFEHRASAAFSSRGSHALDPTGNQWGVDPRLAVSGLTFTNVDHAVLCPIPHDGAIGHPAGYPSIWVGVGPNGTASALIYDVDGCIPGGAAHTYVANNTPLLRPYGYSSPTALTDVEYYAEPIFVPGPGAEDGNAYGQLLFNITSPDPDYYPETIPYITFEAVHRSLSSKVWGPFWSQKHPITLLLENPADDGVTPGIEHYRLTYPTGSPVNHISDDDPRNLEVRLRFSEEGRCVLLEIPYDGNGGAPSSVVWGSDMLGVFTAATSVGSRAAVEGGDGTQYWYDSTNQKLWIRPTLGSLPGASPTLAIHGGREVVFRIAD